MTTHLVTQPYHLPRDGGPALWHLGAVLTFKATSEPTAGRMWAKELLAPRRVVQTDVVRSAGGDRHDGLRAWREPHRALPSGSWRRFRRGSPG